MQCSGVNRIGRKVWGPKELNEIVIVCQPPKQPHDKVTDGRTDGWTVTHGRKEGGKAPGR